MALIGHGEKRVKFVEWPLGISAYSRDGGRREKGNMRRVFVTVMALAMFLSLSATAVAGGGPRANGADKASVYLHGDWNCTDGSEDAGTDSYGFVVMNINNNGTLIGTMHLKGLTPGNDYWLWIAGTGIDGATCSLTPTIANPVTADANGNISYNFTFDEVPAQGAVWVGASGDIRVQSTAMELTYPAAG